MEKITRFSVKYPITIAMMILAVLLLGYLSVGRLGVDLFPDMTTPRLFVELQAGERPPAEMEKQYADALEAATARLSGVQQVSTMIKSGQLSLEVGYVWDKDMESAFLELQRAVSPFQQKDGVEELMVSRYNPNADPILLIGMSHESITDPNDLRKTAQEQVRKRLIRLSGIADVQLSGYEESEIQIQTNDYKLKAFGIGVDQIASKIESVNSNVSGGSITEDGIQYTIKGVKALQNLKDLEQLVVGYKLSSSEEIEGEDRTPVFLSDVASITLSNKVPDNAVYLNGVRCVSLSVYKETRYNTIDAVEAVEEELQSIGKALPGYAFMTINNQGEYIQEAIGEVESSALTGIFLAIIILFVFLRRLKTTIIVSISIPISIVATFNLMYFNDLSINIMTLGGLALGAGMLVDNAIVVMENIIRHIENGVPVRQAAIRGTAEVGGAIVAATLTTIVVFLPIVYLQGAAGELFKEQAWTVAFSLLSSLFVALLVLPMLCSVFLKSAKQHKETQGQVSLQWYARLLQAVLHRRVSVVIVTFLLILGSYFMLPFIGSEFMPRTEANALTIALELPHGTTLDRTSRTVRSVEFMLREHLKEDLEYSYVHVGKQTTSGSAMNSDAASHTATLYLKLKEQSSWSAPDITPFLEEQLSEFTGLKFSIQQEESALSSVLGREGAPIVIEVYGKELDEIKRLQGEVQTMLSQVDGLYEVKILNEETEPEVNLVFDRLRGGILGLDAGAICGQLRDVLEGKMAGHIEMSGEMKEVSVKMPEFNYSDLGDIEILHGNSRYRVSELFDIRIEDAKQKIFRKNQSRVGKVSAQLASNVSLDKAVGAIEAGLQAIDLPPQYKFVIGGEEQQRKSSFSSLSFALLLSIVLVYMVMASQFESLLHPFTILLTIPLAVVGSLCAFFILGISMNMMAYIGVIMLVGIAVNDSIILVDAIRRLQSSGLPVNEAIVQAALLRFRPIVMTSLTTILALLPLTIGFGENVSLRSPMAIAVVAGLFTSTLLSLVVIPCFYMILEGVFAKKRRV